MLTKRQAEFLEFISKHVKSRGYAPTIREIGKRFGLKSSATIHKHLRNLEEKGFLRKNPHRSRGIEPGNAEKRRTASSAGLIAIPLLGSIAAGEPVDAFPDEEKIDIPRDFAGKRATFALRVRGDSMIEEHIKDGDIVIVDQTDHAENGETVVALVNGRNVTLKKFYREGKRVRLQPANPNIDPIYAEAEDVRIQGVVIGVMRKYK